MSKVIKKELELGGKKLILETGELAGHANGSIMATYGETVVLATAVAKQTPPTVDYFPLSVEFEEKLYAAGRISTSRFIKREGRPSETSILTARLIDRSIRPLFPKDYQADVQVIVSVLSYDEENDPDIVALIAASAALSISDIPWNGPLAGVRVGKKEGGFILNPTEAEKETSDLDLVVVSESDGEIVMIEAGAQMVDEKTMAEAFKFGIDQAKPVIKLINELVKETGGEKQKYEPQKLDEGTDKKIRDYIDANFMKNFDKDSLDENWFGQTMKLLEAEFVKDEDKSEVKVTGKILGNILEDIVAKRLRNEILINKKRPDGRKPDEIRPLAVKVGFLPRTHGSAIFQRGETQVLSIATLASPALAQLIEGMFGEEKRRYMHHYNFPPFSTGEVKRMGSPGRREIGHGALAQKAIEPVLPSADVFPYTIRVVSEVLSSAGSTSMASTCGSTLSLMDAGVPIKEPVAGISIGLITSDDKSKYVLITDIAYQEDTQGDMDFKVAGTKDGITAIQMDIKLSGVPLSTLEEALDKAKTARLAILKEMLSVIPEARKTVSKYAPTVILVKILPSKIGEVIGSGGRVINKIIAETGASVDIDDDGTVTISGKDPQACRKAAEWVEGIVREPQPGEEFTGPVKRILPFGAMVEILPGKEGLVHISKMAPYHVNRVEDIVQIGQEVKVKVAEIDDQGRVNLTMNLNGEDRPSEDRPPRRDSGSGPQRFGNRPPARGGRDRDPSGPPKRSY